MENKHLIWSTGHALILNDIVNASNCEIYDSKGNKYIDLESGVWCTSLGHHHDKINHIIKNQIGNLSDISKGY